MDWDHFRRALGHDRPESVRLGRLIDETPFIKDFLTCLIENLRECQTHEECTQKYPQAKFLLNMASMHPFIAADKQMARLLVMCLLEYSKVQYGDTSAALQYQSKSVSWGIARIRHIINASRHQIKDESVIEKRIQQLVTKMDDDLSRQRLSIDKVWEFLDKSLLLLDTKSGPGLITQIVIAAIKIQETGPVVSHRFLQRLVGPSTTNDVWAIYKNWRDDIKLRLWKSHPEILRVELLNLLEYHTGDKEPIDPSPYYASLVKVLHHDRQVCQVVYKIMADVLLELGNWRVFRVGWYLLRALLQGMNQIVPDGLESLADLLEKGSETSAYPEIGLGLKEYIYGGSHRDLTLRRTHAWFLLLLYPNHIYECAHCLVLWTWGDKDKTWDQNIENAATYLSWVICPSDDDRTIETYDRLHAWLISLKAHVGDDYDSVTIKPLLCTLYDDIFCGNVLVTLCMTMAVLSTMPFHRGHHIELLESALLVNNTPNQLRGNRGIENPSPLSEYHQPGLFLFLDLRPLWEQIFGDHSVILDNLIQRVNTIIRS